jgi:aspartyl-tRNA(Asn)/glutamyl-tRNA(Gln) amidotransferase subunit A
VAASEASSNLSRYDGVRYGLRDIQREDGQNVNELSEFYKLTRSRGFGEEVKRRILLGTFSLSAGYYDQYYIKACQVRRLIAQDFQEAFKKCDHIIGPVTTHTAFKINEKYKDPIEMYKNDLLTVPSSLAGLPCMSLPLGEDDSNLPIGLQIISPAFEDSKMIEFAASVEKLLEDK